MHCFDLASHQWHVQWQPWDNHSNELISSDYTMHCTQYWNTSKRVLFCNLLTNDTTKVNKGQQWDPHWNERHELVWLPNFWRDFTINPSHLTSFACVSPWVACQYPSISHSHMPNDDNETTIWVRITSLVLWFCQKVILSCQWYAYARDWVFSATGPIRAMRPPLQLYGWACSIEGYF